MSDPTNNTPVAPTPDQKTIPAIAAIQTEVKETVVQRNADVRKQVVNGLVETELNKRAALLGKAIEARKSLSSKLSSIRPKAPGYDGAGKELPGIFTKQEIDDRKKYTSQLEKLDAAVDNALSAGDAEAYKKLGEACDAAGKGGDVKTEAAE